MKRTILLLLIILFIGCKKENDVPAQKATSKTFFDFDEIEYYKVDISAAEIEKLTMPPPAAGKSVTDAKNELLKNYLLFGYPEKINETEINSFFKSFKNHKIEIDKKYFAVLKSKIFTEKNCNYDQDLIPAIAPIYKDFFIFKKEHKIIGLIKLNSTGPFMHIVIGTKKDARCLGQSNEIEYLEKILKTKLD